MRYACLVAGLACLIAKPALAQNVDKAAAIAAFDEGQALMEEGNVAAACPKFAQSYKLDPQLGALLYLADCLEQNGQIASAWSGFRDAADLAEKRGDSRRAVAEERAAALQPRLSRLQLELPSSVPQGMQITRDGVSISSALWATSIPVDPGEYTIEVTAEGYSPWQSTIEVAGEGSLVTLTVPPLQPLESTTTVAPVSVVEEPESRSVVADKWPALAAGGVALAGAAVWTIFGLKSLDAKSKADELCDGAQCPTHEGVQFRNDAVSAGNVATVGMIVTGVGLASAAVLWFALPFGESESAPLSTAFDGQPSKRMHLGVGPTGLRLEGTW